MSRKATIMPMRTSGTQHLIERVYREGGRYQWCREVLINALEAGAKTIRFGIDWKTVEKHDIYRRYVADDGAGMSGEDLEKFFSTFGAGGKSIGGVHENFGVGSKTSLLPWNPFGVVVVSWVGGKGAMIWIQRDPETGEYGLRLFDARDEDTGEPAIETVVEPFGEWTQKPDFLQDHGTVIHLLGKGPRQNTVLGDISREEGDLKGIAAYLNRRVWQVPEDVEVIVEELRSTDRKAWPRSAAEAYGPEPQGKEQDRRVNRRTILGAKHYVEAPGRKGQLAHSGTVTLKDETKIHWYLWEGERPGVQSYAAFLGYVAALYRNELYDTTSHLSVYRSFGVTAAEVRAKLWLVVEPKEMRDDQPGGVYPRTDRNALLIHGAGNAGEALPTHAWAAEFSDMMPEPIREALRKARGQEGSVEDEAWRARLAERLGTRWKIDRMRVVAKKEGDDTTDPAQLGAKPAEPHVAKKARGERDEAEVTGGHRGDLALGAAGGQQPAHRTRVSGGIPTYRVVGQDEMEPGMIASWMPHDPERPTGVVLLNGEHPVIRQQVAYWSSQYPDHVAPDVEKDVLAVYGQIACARVAHSEKMRGLLPSPVVDDELRSDAALTMSLLGLLAEEAVLAARLGAKYGRKKVLEEGGHPHHDRPTAAA